MCVGREYYLWFPFALRMLGLRMHMCLDGHMYLRSPCMPEESPQPSCTWVFAASHEIRSRLRLPWERILQVFWKPKDFSTCVFFHRPSGSQPFVFSCFCCVFSSFAKCCPPSRELSLWFGTPFKEVPAWRRSHLRAKHPTPPSSHLIRI